MHRRKKWIAWLTVVSLGAFALIVAVATWGNKSLEYTKFTSRPDVVAAKEESTEASVLPEQSEIETEIQDNPNSQTPSEVKKKPIETAKKEETKLIENTEAPKQKPSEQKPKPKEHDQEKQPESKKPESKKPESKKPEVSVATSKEPDKIIQNGVPLGKLVANIPSKTEKVAYLTFDDGPGSYTEQMVSILNHYGIKGSFFWIGHNLTDDLAPLGQQMIEEGHVIGAHTMHHERLSKMNQAQQKRELVDTAAYMQNKIHHPIVYFRPPYGAINEGTKQISREVGQSLIYWQVDSEDWKYSDNDEKIMNNIKNQIKPGSIILMHERAQSVRILPRVIEYLQTNGYTLKPLP